jgi:hypothetical protein
MFLQTARLFLSGGDRLFHASARHHLFGEVQHGDEQSPYERNP